MVTQYGNRERAREIGGGMSSIPDTTIDDYLLMRSVYADEKIFRKDVPSDDPDRKEIDLAVNAMAGGDLQGFLEGTEKSRQMWYDVAEAILKAIVENRTADEEPDLSEEAGAEGASGSIAAAYQTYPLNQNAIPYSNVRIPRGFGNTGSQRLITED